MDQCSRSSLDCDCGTLKGQHCRIRVCDGLAHVTESGGCAHAQKIIHRDLKPENIMVGEFGEVLVMDWGIAKILDSEVGQAVPSPPREAHEPAHILSHERSPGGSDDGAVRTQRPAQLAATMDGAVMGTPNYMSPEQAMGKVNEMDARSDIFSLGGILYAILTLRPPVEGKDVWEVLEKVSSAIITAPATIGVTTGKGKQLTDLTPLTGMPLTDVDIHAAGISRIDALRGMPLTKLNASVNSGLTDCSPLKGAPLETLDLEGAKVSDLSFVKDMPLRSLNANASTVSNIDALRGLLLENLNLEGTLGSDLTPLHGAPLKDLNLRRCKQLTDSTPVLTLPRLEVMKCDVLPAALLPLRESATLQSIEADAYPGGGSQGTRPVADFWRAYDAQQAAGKK